MEERKVRGKTHYLYTKEEADSLGIRYVSWREGKEGDWVETDDGKVCQILKRGEFFHKTTKRKNTWIQTICGKVNQQQTPYFPGVIADNIARFLPVHYIDRNKQLTRKELVFVKLYLESGDAVSAYRTVFLNGGVTNKVKRDEIERRTNLLLRKERIKQLIRREVYDALTRAEVDFDWIITKLRQFVEKSKLDRDKIRALENIIEISGIKDRVEEKDVNEQYGGFTREQLKEVEDDMVLEKEAEISHRLQEVRR